MKKKLIVMLALFFVTSVAANAEKKQEAEIKQEIVELTPSDFKPAFTKNTVIKLNKIVARSLDVINEYDAVIDSVRTAIETKITGSETAKSTALLEQEIAKINALAQQSKLILGDMKTAEHNLKLSGEDYNTVIFAGMMTFVKDVEKEISTQSEILLEKLEKA